MFPMHFPSEMSACSRVPRARWALVLLDCRRRSAPSKCGISPRCPWEDSLELVGSAGRDGSPSQHIAKGFPVKVGRQVSSSAEYEWS